MSAREGGAVLLIALILMAVLTVVATSTLRFSAFGLRVAVNEELRTDAFQNSQSLVDAVLAVPTNLQITGVVNDTNCVSGVSGCTRNTLVLRDSAGNAVTSTQLSNSGSAVTLRRIGPDQTTPPRNTGYSAVRFQASFLQVDTSYDGTAGGWGKAATSEGVTVIVPQMGG